MSSLQETPASPAVAAAPVETIYSVGTLRYTRNQLIVLFVWLMWNDLGIKLIESISSVNGFLMKDHGATYTQMAVLGSIGGFISPWINPWVSTWSDRCRSRYGRRRPFLFIATPPFAVFLIAIPFMPDLFSYLNGFPVLAKMFTHLPMNGPAFFIGVCGLISGLFNAVVLAIFTYLYWDVVPEKLLGRFNSMGSTVTLIAGLIWSFFIFGQAEHHPKEVYLGTGVVSLAVYLLSVWRIKEGEYPPPDEHKKGGFIAPVRAYFVECFSDSFYLWIFVSSLLYQLGNSGNWYQSNYLHYDLQMDLDTLGQVEGWTKLLTAAFGLLLGFYVGTITDRLKPVRLIGPIYLLQATLVFMSYFYIHDARSYLVISCVRSLVGFVQGVIVGAFTVEVFPREKLGQFCSAQAVFYQVVVNSTSPLLAMLFDRLQNNRLGYLWMAVFYAACACTYWKVYLNWKTRRGQTVVPHAG